MIPNEVNDPSYIKEESLFNSASEVVGIERFIKVIGKTLNSSGEIENPATENTLDELRALLDGLTIAIRRLIDASVLPPSMDMSNYRNRVSAILESTTLTTCTTVTGLSSVGTTNLLQAQDLVLGQNLTAWALCCRERIS